MGIVIDFVKRKYAIEIETMNEYYIANKSRVLPIESKQAEVQIEFSITNEERKYIIECIEYNQREEEKFIKIAQKCKDEELEHRNLKNLILLTNIMKKVKNYDDTISFDFWEFDLFMSALEIRIKEYEFDLYNEGTTGHLILNKLIKELIPIYEKRKNYVFPTLKYLGRYD